MKLGCFFSFVFGFPVLAFAFDFKVENHTGMDVRIEVGLCEKCQHSEYKIPPGLRMTFEAASGGFVRHYKITTILKNNGRKVVSGFIVERRSYQIHWRKSGGLRYIDVRVDD